MTEAASAGAPTVYDYRFDPDTLIAGAMAAPTLTVTNPAQTDGSGVQTIYVRLPIGSGRDCIAASTGGLVVVAGSASWVVSPYFSASPPYVELQGPALKALASMSFEFQNLQVSPTTGTAAFVIAEGFGSKGTVTKTIVKTDTPLEIESFYAAPVTVAQGQATTLTWVVSGGSYVLIQPGSVKRPITGGGTFTDSCEMAVGAPSQSYLLQLYTDDRQFKQAVAVGFVGTVMGAISRSPTGLVDTDAEVTLTWSTAFATQKPKLVTPSSVQTVDYDGTKKVTAGSLLVQNQTASETTLTLKAEGFGGPAAVPLGVTYNPVRIRWFRYTDLQTRTVTSSVANPSPGSPTQSIQAQEQVLTAYGPGSGNGPLVAYLGDGPHLQVQLLAATPNPATPGAQVTLSYATLNATSVTLAMDLTSQGAPVDFNAASQSGKTTFAAPQSSTTLVLRALGTGQATVASELDLTVTAPELSSK